MKIKADYANAPQWKEVTIKSTLPKELKCLDELAHNMWWAWNYEARELWKSLDKDLYEEVGHNPVMLLDRLSYERKEAIVKDKTIMERVKSVYKLFRDYMDVKPDATRPSVAYFCMEYGINQVVKIYSGGLGMLAGDYMKEASDSNVNMCGVGFLYRYGYFKQTLSMDGQQIAQYDAQNFSSLPVERVLDENGQPLVVDVPYMNYQVHAYVWVMNVGRIKLYLLDTDNEMNSEFDKPITHALYGGDNENRLKQEILLGIGGMLTLKKLGIKKDVYHCNEGHAALCNLQRLIDYIKEGLSFNEALELVRASSLYTVHTPVPAGHDYFDESLFGKYMGGYPSMLGITWDEFIGMGRTNPDDHSERFCMSTFACNTCQEVNGVSKLHGWVSQRMFAPIWKGYYPEESHVGYVTNGVHFPTWTATEWRKLYAKYFDKNYIYDQSNESLWHAIYNVPDAEIWETRMALKKKLVDYIREKFAATWLKNQGDPSRVVTLLESITPNALYIGFCRRFATYKRAHLLFTDLERLSKIVNNPERPVKFIFSGKAHPQERTYQNQGYQDQLDAATIYSLLENEILPLYYNRNAQGFSEGWIKTIKNSIATIAPHYTMKRQLDDYYDKFYIKEAANFKKLSANNNKLAKELAAWKETVAQRWDSIRVVSKDDSVLYGAETGKKYTLRYVIDEQGLNDAVGLELISIKTDKNGEEHIFSKREFTMVGREGNNYTFEATFEPNVAGAFKSCVRMYPKNENLVYREDFCYVKWLD